MLAPTDSARWLRHAHLDLGEAFVRRDVLAPTDDAIGERDVRPAALQFAHLEARAALAPHAQAAAIASWREEDVIVAAFDLEPVFRGFAGTAARKAKLIPPDGG